MKELSLNILDIAQNSITAGATFIDISLVETNKELSISVSDDGCGMSDELIKRVSDPFYTTRTTRKVGLGIPFLKMEAEQTGGSVFIKSKLKSDFPDCHGTTIISTFNKNHLDFTPLGDIISTICVLIHGADKINVLFTHIYGNNKVELDTRELKKILGEVPLSSPDVIAWIKDYLHEQYRNTNIQYT